MNFWIFNHYAIATGASGPTRHYDLAKELVKKGHQVTIFASSFDHQSRKEMHIFNNNVNHLEEEYEGVKFIWVKTTPYKKNDWRRVLNLFSYFFKARKIAYERNDHPDIVIGSLMHPFAAILGYLVGKKKKCSFYFEERDLWPQSLIDLGKVSKNNPVVWVLSQLELFLYRKSKRVIVLFEKAVDYVKSRGVPEEKIIYLPNGVDFSRYQDLNKELPPLYQVTIDQLKDKLIAIYTGAHGLANHLDHILDTARILKEQGKEESIHFLLIGDGPEKERLIQRKQHEQLKNVTFLPIIAKEYIPTILNQVDVGLLPLQNSPVFKWGISPNKLYDYMASSLPVALLCDIENKTLEQSGGGFVIRENFSMNLAKKLSELSQDKSGRLLMGKRAKDYVQHHHSWDKLSEILLQASEQ